jgi:tRNA G18 (ribose-2'-O)-methylase SpoU
MSEERRNRIERVVMNRTYSICPVVEGLLDLGNIAAVFRSADALGFQSVHVIANKAEKRYTSHLQISSFISLSLKHFISRNLWIPMCHHVSLILVLGISRIGALAWVLRSG